MIIFLYGPDAYRREQKKKFYIAEFAKKYSSSAVERVDLSAGDVAPLAQAARARSLFDPAKLLIIENAFEVPTKKLKPELQLFLNDKSLNALIVAEKKPEKALAFLIQKPVVSAAFDHLEGSAWKKFVQAEAAAKGVDLDLSAIDLLVRTYEKDSWGLVTELEKLAGGDRTLTAADLAALGVEVAADFFPLVQALRSARPGDRFAALARLFHDNEPAAKIFNILAALWTQKTPQFGAYDRAIKMGRMDYEEALTDLLMS